MGKQLLCVLLHSIFIVNLTGTYSFAQSNASLEGYILESETGQGLAGANIVIIGTSLGTSSDLDGKYFIPNLPPGKYTIQVSYIGYQTSEATLEVKAGERIKKHFELTHAALEGETIEVTAQAEGQMEAINKQLSARQIMNVVASDRIQELPDANAAESVGRLPGVSILREGGEGNKVVIRGLSPKYNAVMIEGVRLAATDFEDRSSDLSMISPYMLEGIEVMKAITPDQDADILGGSVNFRIKEAGEGKGKHFIYDIITRGGYNGLKETYDDYKFVTNISSRFFNNRLGVLGELDIERRNRSSHEMGAGYFLRGPELGKPNQVYISGLNLSDITRYRERYGGTLSLDYRFKQGKISLKNLFSFGDTKIQNRSESFNIDGNSHNYSATDTRSKLNVMTNILNYEQRFSSLKVNAYISHALSDNEMPKDLTFNFSESAALREVNQKVHPTKLPYYAVNNLDRTYLATVPQFYQESEDRELSVAVNIEIELPLFRKLSGMLKFGGKYRYKDRMYDRNERSNVYDLGAAQETRALILNAFPWMKETVPSPASNLPYILFIDPDYEPGEFLDSEYTLGPAVDFELMNAIQDVLANSRGYEYNLSGYSSVTQDYAGNEYLSAGYIMADFNIGQTIEFIPGVRFEQLKTSYTAPRGNSSFTGSEIEYRYNNATTNRIHDHWLPMMHIRYKPISWFDVRFAYTNTLSRPDFRAIIPRYNIALNSVSWNNYKLKPSRSQNFDLYFSVHENRVGLFTIGGFVKQIDDLIFGQSRVITDPNSYDLPSFTKGLPISTQINNPNRVRLWGIEADWQTHFWYLPGFLKNFVLNTNYTHIFSEAKYPRTVVTTEYIFFPEYQVIKTYDYSFYKDRMLHQPDDIVNASIGYDYKNFSIRLSMLYQSNIFKGTNFWTELRQITDDYIRWDVTLKQDLPWFGLQVFASLINLTNTLDRDLNQGSLFPTAEQHYGWALDIGVRWKN